jgi:serine/threonine kinase 32
MPKQSEIAPDIQLACLHDGNTSVSVTGGAINDLEVDLSHFTRPNEVLGIGGFGLVRKVIKLTGKDINTEYAMKSTSKVAILARSTGLQAIMTELKALVMLEDCEYICQVHYAFQDTSHLYFMLDYAIGGDMRYNMRRSTYFRFPEGLARVFVKQILYALQHCHQRNILHRGEGTSLCIDYMT